MNDLDDIALNKGGFAFQDIIGQDKWGAWPGGAVVFGSLAVVGAATYVGRVRVMGRSVQFQVRLSAATSIGSTAGTDYLNLPIPAKGYAGIATMTNDTSNIAVGVCHIDVSTSRCYLPTQAPSGNTFTICGSYEI